MTHPSSLLLLIGIGFLFGALSGLLGNILFSAVL
jgi:hypothetical protein